VPDHPDLFDVGRRPPKRRIEFARQRPVWTQNKAKLIERYLRNFLFVTKHGTYIDGFAGPQEEDVETDNWAAKLVLTLEPRWLKHLYLFEEDLEQVARIRLMKRRADPEPLNRKHRDVRIIQGDVNVALPAFLEDHPIRSKEAVFCLLDQRTAECHWSTVETVARHKRKGLKVEIFYFLANAWLPRAVANTTKDKAKLDAWWGGRGWADVMKLDSYARGQCVAQRFTDELGYASAVPLPIYDKAGGRRIMYFMIHATDHPAAPYLMKSAYSRAVEPLETQAEIQAFITGLNLTTL
jgi:three-Cys-motif partner protein